MTKTKKAKAEVDPTVNRIKAELNGHDHTNGKPEEETPLIRLSKADVLACRGLSVEGGRALVNTYYDMQELRKSFSNREGAHKRQAAVLSDYNLQLTETMSANFRRMEADMAKSLTAWASDDLLASWAMSVPGVGGVIAAGLRAHIDLTHCSCKAYAAWRKQSKNKGKELPAHDCPGVPTAGSLWRFAGMNPDDVWEKGKIRPWNARLKTLCWKIGDAWNKMSPKPEHVGLSTAKLRKVVLAEEGATEEDVQKLLKRVELFNDHPGWIYHRLMRGRKLRETAMNEEGAFRKQAQARKMKALQWRRGPTDEQLSYWDKGMLQPMGIHLRAIRYAVKIFLSHYFVIGKEILTGRTPRDDRSLMPYVNTFLGHPHYIPPYNWPMQQS